MPLHYAFVKIGNHKNYSSIDPIEACSMLVEAMKGKNVDLKDEYGSTPLHYAAYRGATVSCLFLLQNGADINAVDDRGNTPLAYAVYGKHEGCALILLQKGASVNVTIKPFEKDMSGDDMENRFPYLPGHFRNNKQRPISLFQGIIQNSWLGITYVALDELEKFGLSYAKAVETAMHMQKIQFAKTLIGKQVSVQKLLEKVSKGRNLLTSLAYECKCDTATDIQEDVAELLVSAGVSLTERDEKQCIDLHYA